MRFRRERVARAPHAARDFVSRMQEEIDGLAQLAQELLSLARVGSGADRLTLVEIAPGLLLRDTARRMVALAERAGVAIEVDAGEDLPDVRADVERMGQVLANLVDNAVTFRVRESGIDPADLDRAFERFYESDRSRASGGTGRGLAIATHIVQAP